MLILNKTASAIPFGPYVLKPKRSRSVPGHICRERPNAVLLEQLLKHERVEATPEEGDSSLAVPVKEEAAHQPEAESMTRVQLAAADMRGIIAFAIHLGIPPSELDEMTEDEARLYVGSVGFSDPGLIGKNGSAQSEASAASVLAS